MNINTYELKKINADSMKQHYLEFENMLMKKYNITDLKDLRRYGTIIFSFDYKEKNGKVTTYEVIKYNNEIYNIVMQNGYFLNIEK